MKSYSPKEVIRILKDNGWKNVRITGDHYMFTKENKTNTIAVPVSKKDIKIGTLKSIERKTGIKFK